MSTFTLSFIAGAYVAGVCVTYVDVRNWLLFTYADDWRTSLVAMCTACMWPVVAALSLSLYVRSLFK